LTGQRKKERGTGGLHNWGGEKKESFKKEKKNGIDKKNHRNGRLKAASEKRGDGKKLNGLGGGNLGGGRRT